MAFSSAVCNKTVFGNKQVRSGCWTAAAVTTGSIDTGLAAIDCGTGQVYTSLFCSAGNTSTAMSSCETGSCIVILNAAVNSCGGWIAWGRRK